MKKFLLIAIVALSLSACAPLYNQKAWVGDFRKYTEENFTISTLSTGFQYSPIGAVEIKFYDGYVKKDGVKEKAPSTMAKDDPIYGNTNFKYTLYSKKKYDYFSPSYDYMLSELVAQAKELGATGILDLKIYPTVIKRKYGSTTFYTASGLAVKIQ